MTVYVVLRFITEYFDSNLFSYHYQSFCIFIYSMYTSSQYINTISINQKLMCTILFQAIMVYLNHPNSVL
jgi:hypothetical protein